MRLALLATRVAAAAAAACIALASIAPSDANAQSQQDAGAPSTTAPSDAGATGDIGGCVETIPKGAQRPIVSEAFPLRGTSG